MNRINPAATPGSEHRDKRSSLLCTFVIGSAVMAALDEIVFHQILAWHHFFDRSTPLIGLMSDGFLHAAELIALVGGFFWFSEIRQRKALAPQWAWSGLFLGLGAFQLFDGIVDHKILRLHQIRYNVNIVPYDIAWNAFAILLLVIGFVLWRRADIGSSDLH